MLDHVSLGVGDLDASRRFYDVALKPLGLVRIVDFEGRGSDYGTAPGSVGVEFTITREERPVPSAGAHICFRAIDRAAVAAFHAAAVGAGGRDDGRPGLRLDTTQPTMPPSSSTRTVTASRRSATRRTHPRRPDRRAVPPPSCGRVPLL